MKNAIRTCIACLLVLAGSQALAMYRCGNVFQDKPCESGKQIDLSPSGRSPATAAPPPAAATRPSAAPATSATFAIACSRVGEQAQRITWKREGGASMEQQLAERATVLSQDEQANTVRAVYARRGTAPEIRSQIESECMAEKERQAQAAEMLRQLRIQAGETPAKPPVGDPAASATAIKAADNAPAAASSKPSKERCDGLKRSVDYARSRLAQGGSARMMEQLQADRRDAEKSLRESGC